MRDADGPPEGWRDREAKGRFVRGLFGAVAPTYDLLNSLLSFGLHHGWRRAAARAAALPPTGRALDVATGTGDLAFELARHAGPEGSVLGVDFCEPMLKLALPKRRRLKRPAAPTAFALGDALALPFRDACFDAATIAFGLRNTADLRQCLREMARVVRPGGRVVVLEFAKPPNPLFRAVYFAYFGRLLPAVGKLVHGNRDNYQYLPDSVREFADRDQLSYEMEQAGLGDVRYRDLTFGIVALHVGTRRSEPAGGAG